MKHETECIGDYFIYFSLEERGKLEDELKRADAVVLTYACDQPSTLDRLSTFWLPELRRLEVYFLFALLGKILLFYFNIMF